MPKRQRILLFSSLGLFVIALLLLGINRWMKISGTGKSQEQTAVLNWQAFPTRSQNNQISPQADAYHETIQLAILRQDYNTAQSIIDEAEALYPDDARIWQHKARLALARSAYDEAEELIWHAIGLDSSNAVTWAFAGVIFTRNQKQDLANQALSIAIELNPELATHLFQERWQFAINNNDSEKLTQLADEYFLLHEDDTLADYYFAVALRYSDQNNIALHLLVDRLTKNPQSPAVLWFTLGQAYFDNGSYKESATAFENAYDLFRDGDASMLVAFEEPEHILIDQLAKAYLGMQRCVSAEAMFRRLSNETKDLEYSNWITKAVTCQTPTPTATHWMISKQKTPTPSP